MFPSFEQKQPFWVYIVGSLFILLVNLLLSVILSTVLHHYQLIPGIGSTPTDFSLDKGNLILFLFLLPSLFSLVTLWFVASSLHKTSFKSMLTNRKQVDWQRIFFSFLLWGVVISFFILLNYWLAPQDFQLIYHPKSFFLCLLILLLMLPLQVAFEELYFRSYLLNGLIELTKSRGSALVISSLVFGLLHLANPEIEHIGYEILAVYVLSGFVLGIIALMDNGLELSLGIHLANNFFTALLITADWSVLKTAAIFKATTIPKADWALLLPFFILYPLLLVILSKKYRWQHWLKYLIRDSNYRKQDE